MKSRSVLVAGRFAGDLGSAPVSMAGHHHGMRGAVLSVLKLTPPPALAFAPYPEAHADLRTLGRLNLSPSLLLASQP
jgi:hypothetical protein